MKLKKHILPSLFFGLILIILASCGARKKESSLGNFKYRDFKDSITRSGSTLDYDSTNIFDDEEYAPEEESLDSLLLNIKQMWRNQLFQGPDRNEADSMTEEEKGVARVNLIALDSFLASRKKEKPATCREYDCVIYARIVKSIQKMFLYIDGELVDSFLVSTGMSGKYETKNFSVRPHGPIFKKYTSRKFPGGNYMGLGNMPYAVFVLGGYAIHGTTPGNFSKLGKRASHGCIRLHPDNGKIFNELVRRVGLENTWVTVTDHR